jgi:methyl-accepting chemotaxis protein
VGREKAGAIRGLLTENKTHIDGLITSVSSGVESTRQSMSQIKELELVSRKIDKIVDAITQVSIQTNMLAVNGSIEAARAGEYGKGFVVVATDIRNLAHDSAENADRIKDLVKSIQDQIAFVGRDLSEIISAAMARWRRPRPSPPTWCRWKPTSRGGKGQRRSRRRVAGDRPPPWPR